MADDGGTARAREPAAVILAAGEGRRLGMPKALVTFRGELLLERAIRLARDGGCDPVIVVLGASAEEVRAGAHLASAHVVVAENWAQGMGESLRAGLRAAATTQAGAVVVLLVDQPLIGPEALRRLTAAWKDGATAAIATYEGQPAQPVLLDRSVWSEVAATAQGDVGARGWLRAHPAKVTGVACDGTGEPADIDTPDDLRRLS